MQEQLKRIEAKVDCLADKQHEMQVVLAEHSQIDRNHQKNIERFWNNTWPEVVEKIEGNSTRLGQMEVEIAKLRTTMVIWGSALSVGVPILATVIMWLLQKKP